MSQAVGGRECIWWIRLGTDGGGTRWMDTQVGGYRGTHFNSPIPRGATYLHAREARVAARRGHHEGGGGAEEREEERGGLHGLLAFSAGKWDVCACQLVSVTKWFWTCMHTARFWKARASPTTRI